MTDFAVEIFFGAAALATAAVGLLHLIVGGREIARPLLEARDIHRVAKYTNYYCWHAVTVVLFAMAAAFAWAALDPGGWAAAVVAAGLAVGFAVFGLILVWATGQKHRLMPQWMLFAGVSALALSGLIA